MEATGSGLLESRCGCGSSHVALGGTRVRTTDVSRI